METVTITDVQRFTTKKDGTPLVTKTNKPFTSIRIKCQEYEGRIMSGFGDPINALWKAGDKVEVLLTQNGEYWNFSTPKKEDKNAESLEWIKNKLLNISLNVDIIKERLTPTKGDKIHYPSPAEEGIDVDHIFDNEPTGEINPDDVPF